MAASGLNTASESSTAAKIPYKRLFSIEYYPPDYFSKETPGCQRALRDFPEVRRKWLSFAQMCLFNSKAHATRGKHGRLL
jgi:hypothetical protein